MAKHGAYAHHAGPSKSAGKAADPELLFPQVSLLCAEAADRNNYPVTGTGRNYGWELLGSHHLGKLQASRTGQ